MAGTTPLIIHVPASEPISKSIKMEGIADPIVETIFSRMIVHFNPSLCAIIPAIAAATNKAIWFAPERVSSKRKTFSVSKTIKIRIGKSAPNKDDSRFIQIIFPVFSIKMAN